jgi:hypothetical protein
MTDTALGDQSELQCSNCAGQCSYSPAHRGLQCASCGTVFDLKTDDDHKAAAETGFDPALSHDDLPDLSKTRAHHCNTCGGDVLFTGTALSERCPYCDGAVVLSTQDAGYHTMALIPFDVDDLLAQHKVQRWVKRRIATPNDLGGIVAQGRVAGLYAPFWTFDSEEAVEYWAQYTVGSGDDRRTRSTKGNLRISFNDLLMPASPHITPLIRDGILHDFHPSALRPYRAGYLAGFAAERHHQSVIAGLKANADDKRLLIRNRIKRHINKSGVHNMGYRTDTTGIHYRRILLPVWILHYEYKGKPMKVVVSGIDGRTYGERPFSMAKVAMYSALLSAVAIGIGLAWGAGGLL